LREWLGIAARGIEQGVFQVRERKRATQRALTGLAVFGLVVGSASAAFASHFRGSEASFTMSGDVATWIVDSAWATHDGDSFVGGVGTTVEITQLASAADVPGSGTPTGVFLEVTDEVTDTSNELFDLTTETLVGDLSALGDGLYEVYLPGCCRIDGPLQNSTETDFSQWVRVTKAGGAYDIAPLFNTVSVYALLSSSTDTVLDFTAADSSAVTYTFASPGAPEFGATGLPCSTFAAGILRVGPSFCTGGDVYTDIYFVGSYWVVKVIATDAAGNESVTDTLLRVFAPPEPHIYSHEFTGNGTSVSFDVYAEDTLVDEWTVTCVGVTDPSDIVSGTSLSAPVLLQPFTIGEEYVCEVTASNAAGSGTSADGWTIGPIVLDGVEIVTDLAVGDVLAGSTVQLVGTNLMALSAFTLEQLPQPGELTSGAADGSGEFDEPFGIPASACVSGAGSLVLTGVGVDATPRTDTVWYVLDADCRVVLLSLLGPVVAPPGGGGGGGLLPPTGDVPSPSAWGAAFAAVLVGTGFAFAARGRRSRAQT
jgi:hypothetical protein